MDEERLLLCRKCKERKPESQFSFQKTKNSRMRHAYCRPCATENTREWRKKNPEKFAAQKKRTRRNKRFAKYSISEWEYEDLLEIQGGLCAICRIDLTKADREPHIDHCHDSLKVRGILCGSCNIGLGMFKDSIDVMKKAINYLENAT